MLTSSPSSPVSAKDTRPDWQAWMEDQIEGKKFLAWPSPYKERYTTETTRKVGAESQNMSFCGCCGAIWVTPEGKRKAIGYRLSETYGDRGTSLNKEGIYFAEDRPAEDLVAIAELVGAHTFEIKDGNSVHSFAWKDF